MVAWFEQAAHVMHWQAQHHAVGVHTRSQIFPEMGPLSATELYDARHVLIRVSQRKVFGEFFGVFYEHLRKIMGWQAIVLMIMMIGKWQ